MLSSLNLLGSGGNWRNCQRLGLVALAAFALLAMNNSPDNGPLSPAAARGDDKTQPGAATIDPAGPEGREKASKSRDAAGACESLPRPTKFEEQLLAALEKRLDVEFIDLALEDCLQHLHEQSQLPVWIDKQTLTDEGIALDQPITLKLKGSRLESLLNLVLKPAQLTFFPEDDVLVITTAAKASETLTTRTYPVSDLYIGRVETEVAKEAALPQAKPAPPKKSTDLLGAITTTIDPDTWEELSGPGSYTYVKETNCLVVRQTWAVHRKILQLLRDLREAKRMTHR